MSGDRNPDDYPEFADEYDEATSWLVSEMARLKLDDATVIKVAKEILWTDMDLGDALAFAGYDIRPLSKQDYVNIQSILYEFGVVKTESGSWEDR